MKINKVMIAGMDNKTSIPDLEKIKKDFPFVEWGVLFSSNKQGSSRYPSLGWIADFVNSNTGSMSAHFCGSYSKSLMESMDTSELLNLSNKFDAVQINYNMKFREQKWSYSNLLNTINVAKSVNKDIILQVNNSNIPYLNGITQELLDSGNVRVLYDASGGRGKPIKTIHHPATGLYTGYAGGINPDNITNICHSVINNIALDTVWLDLESGVRNAKNNFNLNKVRDLLEKSYEFILQ